MAMDIPELRDLEPEIPIGYEEYFREDGVIRVGVDESVEENLVWKTLVNVPFFDVRFMEE